ncbi:multicopper oxidase domain-containing protein [Haladaptatus pallidirubidus]|nr:multicopper oxidase domain-containing protein [Haladaptatus pallidirubidus]
MAGGALATSTVLNRAGLTDSMLEEDEPKEVPDEPTNGGKVRQFTVHAISTDIVYNKYGLHQPNAAMYVLEENLEEARKASGKVPDDAFALIDDNEEAGDEQKSGKDKNSECNKAEVDTSVLQPLTIRANKGDIVEIKFVNHLCRHASIHQTALPYNVQTSDGLDVGYNDDTTVAPGDSIEYKWHASHRGTHYFYDGANPAVDSGDKPPEEANLLSRGLFGSIVVEPEGATWTDPETGEKLRSGVNAIIHDPQFIGTSYREFVVHYHTPEGIYTCDDEQLTFPNSDEPQTTHAINYRADPTGNRLREDCPDCAEDEFFYNSWVHGDPGGGDIFPEAYLGDPTKFVAVSASLEENHVHHLHGHRWKEVPDIERSDTIDSQTIGLGAAYETYLTAAHGNVETETSVRPDMTSQEAFEVGAGGAHRSTGDYLFHCHLFPHYGEGMWSLFRVHDQIQDHLKALPGNNPPNQEDDLGFPDFIPGEKGEQPPEPPSPIGRQPTSKEREALGSDILPGAPYTDPCDPQFEPAFEGEKREYTIVGVPANIAYNDAGDHDPDGMVFALEEDAKKIKNGEMNPEPLVIRANVGDCIEVTLKDEFDVSTSNHPHFVSFDVLGSDSLATGYNYSQSADPGPDGELTFRWYADEEGTIFFHDHITGIENVMHGMFCGLIIEPRDSEWLDPYSGKPIRSGTQAIIKNPNGNDFREQALAFHDFAQLVDRDGNFVTQQEEHQENAGVMAINLRNTPYYHRDDCDPAYVHSSYVHGDPETPVVESYAGDPLRLHVWQAAWEEQHNFFIHENGLDPEGFTAEESTSHIFGTSEAFTFQVQEDHDFEEMNNPSGLPVRDYLFGSSMIDDIWNGMWGLHRTFDAEVNHLQPLPDRGTPSGKISNKQLKKMGHPAPYSNWEENGQKDKLLYDKKDDQAFPPDKDERQNDGINGNPPPLAPEPGNPCSDDSPITSYDVTAFQTEIEFDDYGDHDPCGVIFALDEHVEDIKAGRRQPEPLMIRVNRGDCVEINLTNDLPHDLGNNDDQPQMRPNQQWERSERISLHSGGVEYDANGSDGATVGFNYDQTIPPGETITYRWSGDTEFEAAVMWDMADLRSNRHRGAFGKLMIEPQDSTWLDPVTGEPYMDSSNGPANTGTNAIVKNPNGADFREFGLSFSDGRYIINEKNPDSCVVPPGFDADEIDPDDPCNQLGDPEDQGYGAINNRAEPFIRRFDKDPRQHKVYSSEVHGDPATPVLNAYLNDPVTFRVQMSADKARGITFHLADHQWDRFTSVTETGNRGYIPIGVDDRFGVGKALSFKMHDGAGGVANSTGDFIYQETKERRRLESGLWGIFRVGDKQNDFQKPIQPLPDRCQIPIDDRPGWQVARGDFTGDGTRDILVGVSESNLGGSKAGAAYLFTGPIKPSQITDLTDADVRIIGTAAGEQAGTSVALTDYNGNGSNDIVIKSNSKRYIIPRNQIAHGKESLSQEMRLADAAIKEEL